MAYDISDSVKIKLKEYLEIDRVFKEEWEIFEDALRPQLDKLDSLRERRNEKLDIVKRAMREDIESSSDFRAFAEVGPFKISKRWSNFYIPEKLVAILQQKGLYEAAKMEGIVETRIDTAPFSVVQQFLEKNGVLKDFECCEDGKESGSAITGPKSIPPLATELKKE